MQIIELYDCLYDKLAPVVSRVDPGHLGGAIGEYDKDINEIIRIVIEEKRLLSVQELCEIFKTYTGNFATLDEDDAKAIIDSIESVLLNNYEKP